MRHRALFGIISMLGVAALFGLFAALASPLSPPDSAYAQSNTVPSFPSGATTRDVDEKTPSYRDIGDPVTATDDDDTLTYSLENSGVSHFRIDGDTGQLQTGAPLDYEAQSSYTVKVKATDPAGATAHITVTITVNDVEESGSVSLSWKQPQVGTVLTATLADPDGDISGITWQWARSNSSSKTANYTDISGATSNTYTPVANQERRFLRATATYNDGEGTGKSAPAVSYRLVRSTPSSNSAPMFDKDAYSWSVSRTAPIGTEIYNPAYATDADGDEMRYSVEGTDAAYFDIVPSNGYLVTKELLNGADAKDQYSVTLRISDPSGDSDTAPMTVGLSGGSWNPVVKGPERITYPENGTWQLAKYTAEVPDGPTNGWLVSVEPGGGEGDFFRMKDDGVLTFIQPPDYEDPADDGGNNEYSFTIEAYDGNPPRGQQPGKTWVNVRVTVTNVDEVLEINGPTAVDYAEDRTDAVASYTVTGNEAPVSWELSGVDSGQFDISSGGELTFKTPRDYDNPEDADGDNAYLLSITVTDGTETKKVEPVRVRVTNVNASPAFAADAVTLSVPENTRSYANIDEPVTATDQDSGDSLNYTWGGDDASSFDVLSYSGQVQTLDPLDYETKNSYSITVSVSDGKDSSDNADPAVDDTIDVTITVTNEDDDGTITLSADQPQVGTALIATLTDPDGTVSGTIWVWESSADGSTGWTTLNGASSTVTTSSYTPVAADVGKFLRATATYTDPQGSGKSAEAVSANAVQAAPVTNSDPEFPSTESGARSVAENTAAGEDIGAPVAATDTDNGDTLTYTLGVNDTEFFDIVEETGQLQTKAPLDHETKDSYTVTVSVRDSKNADGVADTADDDTIDVTITVTNEDDDGTVTLSSDQPQVGTALIATLTDPDGTVSGTIWVWESSADGSTGWTTLNGASSTVTTSSYTPVAADLNQYLRAKVTYTDPEDSGKSAEAVSANPVQATPVTNSDPEFPSTENGARTIAENTAAGQNIGDAVVATDANSGDTLTYTLDGTDSAFFTIISTSGQLQTKDDLDYETEDSYTVTVSVRDSKDDSGVADTADDDTIDVTITVTNEEEDGTVTLSSDQPQVGTALIATLTDPDGTVSGTIWVWESSADGSTGWTTLNGASSTVTTSSYTPVAADLNQYLRATATYTDPEGSDKSAEAVSANPVQAVAATNSDPEFPSTENGARTVAENTAAGQNIGAPVAATDANSGDTLTYSIDGTESAPFTIISTSGQLQTKDDLDYETKSSYTFTVSVHDGKNATGGADDSEDDSIEVTITVDDVNEAPEFPSTETGARSVAENTAGGEDIGAPVAATDDDSGDTLTYTLGVANLVFFDIVEETGQLQTKDELDYETKASYTVTVSVRDSKDDSGVADTADDDSIDVTITVTDEEEDGTVTLSSAWPQIGTELTASLSDPDGSVTGLTWQWASAATATGAFTDIVGAASASYTPVDGDLGKYLQATATYTDPQGSGKSASAVSANPTNKAPSFSADLAARLVEENTGAGQDIGTALTATDADTLTYTLGGTDAAFFSIIETSGQLQTKASLDYEGKSSYEVTVTATDPSDESDSITVTITVINVDEAGTVELSTVQPQVGTALTASLTDPDGDPSGVTWQWARGDSETGPFTNVSSGANPASYTPVTADVNKFLRATATYTDPQGSGKSAAAVSENAVQAAPGTNSEPVFSADTATRSVAENTAAETNFGTAVTATDANSDTLTYTLGGTDAASFYIVAGSGQLQTKASLDYEGKSSYEVTVTATDPSDESDSITVTITVINVDEAGTVELSTVQPQVGTALTASLTDPDGDPSGVTWQWARGDSETGPFTNVSSGANPASYTPVTADVNKFLRATASYTDRQGPGKSAIGVSANPVQAAPATNSAPVFSADAATRSVAENAAPGSNIGTPVTATDSDADTLTYSLGGDDVATFTIVNTSGQLQTKELLDYEVTPSYTVTVTATDPSDESDSITVTITVINVDEAGTVELSTVQPQVGTALTASLTDPDGDPSGVTWQWARGDSETGPFTNVSSGANPATYTPVTADVNKFLRATASYTDRQGPGKSAIGVSANPVQAAPATNSAPVFSADAATRSVAENAAPGSNIGTPVTATDSDADTLTYSLGGDDVATFTIVNTSGQLQTKELLDYEVTPSYTVTVTATDPSGAADTIDVTITVINVDEPGTVELSALQPQVDTALTATLTDPDGATTSVTWQWAREDTPGSFSNVGSGASYTPVALDVGKFLRATATYTDPQGSGKSALAVSANPVLAEAPANSDPAFSANTATRSVDENTPANQNIGAPVAATDANNGDTLTYRLGGDDAANFRIVDTSGQLQTKDALDYEDKDSYTVTVSVRDSKDSSGTADSTEDDTITVTISVNNLDEAGTVTLLPAQPQVDTPLTATLTDPDGVPSSISWQWAKADSATGTFANISSATSASYTPVDEDAEKFLQATASYTDPEGPGKSAAGVSGNAAEADSLQSTAETNSAPEFPSTETGARSIAENTAADTDIGAPVSATDADNDTLTYSLGVTDTTYFSIDSTSGQLKTKGDLNYEGTNSYTVTVSVHDGKNATEGVDTTVDDTITVTITVTNVNEAPVVAGPVTKNYPENGTATVDTYTAQDPENDNFTWRLSGVDAVDFAISGGNLTFSPSPDFEVPTNDGTDNVYQVTVEAFDGTKTGILDVTVTVTNVNEPPAFPSTETGARSVVENTEAGQNIGSPVKAADPDNGDTLTYALGGTDAGSFDIVTTSGQLQTKDGLNREAKDSYTVTVSVRDSKNASGAADTATDASVTVTITVTDENETPVITGDSSPDYVENDTADVANYTATDPDNGTIIWSLSGADASKFFISANGVLTFKTSPDFEARASSNNSNAYQVTVEATDGTNPVTLDVTVSVTNVEEAGTVTLSSVQPQVDTVLTATLSDPDIVSGNPTWQWARGDSANGSFTNISGATSATYTPVDADKDKYLQLTASYTDGHSANKSADVVSDNAVQAVPVASNTAPDFSDATTTRTIPENTAAATNIGDAVSATDAENDTLTYSLDEAGAASFDIIPVSGQLQTKAALDHETTSSYTVTVTATDTFGLTDTIAVTITVTDVNEAPEFPTETGARSVAENTAAGQSIGGPVEATDEDPGDTLFYSLGGTDAASFTIDELTGQISVGDGTTLNFEGKKKSYTVTVSVRDSKDASGNADTATDDTIDVTITVTNVDEAPVVTGPATPTFAENGTGTVATYTATDPEGKTISWYLQSGGDSDSFEIDGGVLTFKTPPNHEVKADSDGNNEYLVTIAASADGQSGTLDVSVTVTPVNEAPVVSGLASKNYPENGTGGVDTYTAIDPEGGSVTWSPLSGDDRGDFNISSTGALTFKTPPNFEAPADRNRDNIYLVTVNANDGTSTGRKAVSVTVTNVNEAPAFAANTATRSIAENTVSGRNIGSPVAATDPDRDSALNFLTYSPGSGTDAGYFTIVPTSGQFQTKSGLDYEAKSSYTVTLLVRDSKNAAGITDSATDDTIVVTINVINVNESLGKPAVPTVAPASARGHNTLSVSWSAPSNTGPAISGYGLEYRKKGTGSWLTANVSFAGTTATINSVLPDTDYEVRVRAKNAEGNGGWSDPGTGRTEVTPVNLQITLTVNYRSASYSVTEGSSRSIAVTLSAPADRALQIPITIADGTAEAGDYQVSGLTSNALAFAPGDSSQSFTIRAVSDSDRSDETVSLGFGDTLPNKVEAGGRNTATVTISDDDRVTNSNDRDNNRDTLNSSDSSDDDDPEPIQKIVNVSPPANRPPVFTEGVSTERSLAEHTDRAVYIGEPVTATDANGDRLTYSLGSVVDGESFAIDEVSSQLITRLPLDFETKPSYTVVVGVSDGRGAGDAIVVTINLTDLQEVPITNPRTQAVGKVRPDAATTIETPDGAASVTFPVGSRENSYQVRVDSDASSCGGELPEGALRVSLTVEYFDNWGIQEYDVALERPATIRFRLNATELGGLDQVLAAHRRGGFSIYSNSGVTGEWSEVEFMLEDDGQGIITLTARGLRRLNCFAATTDAAAFAPLAQPVTENPTPEPTPRPTDTATAASLEMTFPRALPAIVPYVPEEYRPTPPAISRVKEVIADSEPEAPETPPAPQLEKSENPPLWPMLMMIAGATLMASGGGLYLVARRRRQRRWR